jgi:hypothetical protein
MTEQPPNQDDDGFLSSFERYLIFNEIYNGRLPPLDPENDLFKKSFNELESENTIYREYLFKLKDLEEKLKHDRLEAAFKLKEASEKLKRAEELSKQESFEAAERIFFSKAGPNLFESIILKQICSELGHFFSSLSKIILPLLKKMMSSA